MHFDEAGSGDDEVPFGRTNEKKERGCRGEKAPRSDKCEQVIKLFIIFVFWKQADSI